MMAKARWPGAEVWWRGHYQQPRIRITQGTAAFPSVWRCAHTGTQGKVAHILLLRWGPSGSYGSSLISATSLNSDTAAPAGDTGNKTHPPSPLFQSHRGTARGCGAVAAAPAQLHAALLGAAQLPHPLPPLGLSKTQTG